MYKRFTSPRDLPRNKPSQKQTIALQEPVDYSVVLRVYTWIMYVAEQAVAEEG